VKGLKPRNIARSVEADFLRLTFLGPVTELIAEN